MGGGTAGCSPHLAGAIGLSPRGRGNPALGLSVLCLDGSIPAWAGEPSLGVSTPFWSKVYPRVGGGTTITRGFLGCLGGLSPRGRGNLHQPLPCLFRQRSIPAWAGEPSARLIICMVRRVYPRVGGGTDLVGIPWMVAFGLSPRGRGNPSTPLNPQSPSRSIPAWAGEPATKLVCVGHGQVYPRVGGGTLIKWLKQVCNYGLSPRGRGNP